MKKGRGGKRRGEERGEGRKEKSRGKRRGEGEEEDGLKFQVGLRQPMKFR